MSKIVTDVIIQTIQAAGVKRCYEIVGDTLNRIAHAIDQSDIISVIPLFSLMMTSLPTFLITAMKYGKCLKKVFNRIFHQL
jgi:hypothetical protein